MVVSREFGKKHPCRRSEGMGFSLSLLASVPGAKRTLDTTNFPNFLFLSLSLPVFIFSTIWCATLLRREGKKEMVDIDWPGRAPDPVVFTRGWHLPTTTSTLRFSLSCLFWKPEILKTISNLGLGTESGRSVNDAILCLAYGIGKGSDSMIRQPKEEKRTAAVLPVLQWAAQQQHYRKARSDRPPPFLLLLPDSCIRYII